MVTSPVLPLQIAGLISSALFLLARGFTAVFAIANVVNKDLDGTMDVSANYRSSKLLSRHGFKLGMIYIDIGLTGGLLGYSVV
jgi:hypothetical protein